MLKVFWISIFPLIAFGADASLATFYSVGSSAGKQWRKSGNVGGHGQKRESLYNRHDIVQRSSLEIRGADKPWRLNPGSHQRGNRLRGKTVSGGASTAKRSPHSGLTGSARAVHGCGKCCLAQLGRGDYMDGTSGSGHQLEPWYPLVVEDPPGQGRLCMPAPGPDGIFKSTDGGETLGQAVNTGIIPATINP